MVCHLPAVKKYYETKLPRAKNVVRIQLASKSIVAVDVI